MTDRLGRPRPDLRQGSGPQQRVTRLVTLAVAVVAAWATLVDPAAADPAVPTHYRSTVTDVVDADGRLVEVTIDGLDVTVKGPKGELSRTLPDGVELSRDEDGAVVVTRLGDGGIVAAAILLHVSEVFSAHLEDEGFVAGTAAQL